MTRLRLRLILIAIPALIVAVLAAWILIAFFAARAPFGRWNITVNDHGTLVAQGRIDLVVDFWAPALTSAPPFLRFEAINVPAHTTGQLTLSPEGRKLYARTSAEPFDLTLITYTPADGAHDGELWINGRQHRELCSVFMKLDAATGTMKSAGEFIVPTKEGAVQGEKPGDLMHIPADISR